MTVGKKAVPKELLDSLLADYRKPEDLIHETDLALYFSKKNGRNQATRFDPAVHNDIG